MKKILILMLACIMLFSGCGMIETAVDIATDVIEEEMQSYSDSSMPSQENVKDDGADSDGAETLYDEGRFTFSVPSGYTSRDQSFSFFTDAGDAAMGINAVSVLGSSSLDEIMPALLDVFASSGEIVSSSDELSDFVSIDGSACKYGWAEIAMTDTTYAYMEFIMAPSKNLLISTMYQAQTQQGLIPDDLAEIRNSIEFTIGLQDEITGGTFVNQNDFSELVLNSDATYTYYQTEGEHSDNYYSGTYEVFYGSDATAKLISMKDYGYTAEELDTALRNNMNGYALMSDNSMPIIGEDGELVSSASDTYFICEDTFHLIILTHETATVDGVSEDLGDVVVPFLGYYLPDMGGFDSLNLNTVSSQFWQRQ